MPASPCRCTIRWRSPEEAKHEYGITLIAREALKPADAVDPCGRA